MGSCYQTPLGLHSRVAGRGARIVGPAFQRSRFSSVQGGRRRTRLTTGLRYRPDRIAMSLMAQRSTSQTMTSPTRRSFLGTAAALPAVAAASTHPADGSGPHHWTDLKLAVATYSLRKFSRSAAIDIVRGLGIKYVNVKSFHMPYYLSADDLKAARAEFAGPGSNCRWREHFAEERRSLRTGAVFQIRRGGWHASHGVRSQTLQSRAYREAGNQV